MFFILSRGVAELGEVIEKYTSKKFYRVNGCFIVDMTDVAFCEGHGGGKGCTNEGRGNATEEGDCV